MAILYLLLGAAAAYLIGSFPTSFIMGKFKGIDVRKEGSGNVGATNVLRTVGKLPALITLVIDILKGAVAVTCVAAFFYKETSSAGYELYRALLGLAVVAGHNWTIFLRFKGGKGVATSCGVLGVLMPKVMMIAILIFLITVAVTKYVSLASLHLAVTAPIIAALSGEPLEYTLLAVTICLIISYRHKDNIKRLLAGTEKRIGKPKVSI